MLITLIVILLQLVKSSSDSSKAFQQQDENVENVIVEVITTTTIIHKVEQEKTENVIIEDEDNQNLNDNNKDTEINPLIDPQQIINEVPNDNMVVIEEKKKCYIVKTSEDPSSLKEFLESKGISIETFYTKHMTGFSICVDDNSIIEQITSKDKDVNIVEDSIYNIATTQFPISRHLFLTNNYLNNVFNNYFYDNIVFRFLFIDKLFRYLLGSYKYTHTGKRTRLYLLDTTVDVQGNVNNLSGKTRSCNNHGNINISLIKDEKKGYSKDAEVTVLDGVDCDGKIRLSRILEQLEQIDNIGLPNVLLFGISGPYSLLLNDVVDKISAKGTIVVSPAGNNHDNSCYYSPGSSKSSLTVGSVNKHANISQFSNYGSCVRLYSLGEELDFTNTTKGTSFSSANVASAILMFLEENPNLSFSDVWKFINTNSYFKGNTHLVFRMFSDSNQGTFTVYEVFISYIFPILILIVVILIIYWLYKRIRKRRERKREYILEPNLRHHNYDNR